MEDDGHYFGGSRKAAGMRVWILDDKHFPTGYANGILEHEDLNLRRKFLRESHVDVMGPMAEASVLVPMHTPEEKLVSAVLFRRTGKDEELTGEPIELDVQPEDKFVYFSVPEGLYRVFFVFETFSGRRKQKALYRHALKRIGAQAH